jgi:choline dehydrogenase-like flavoprotein
MRPMFAAFHSGAVSQDCIERFSRPTDFGKAHVLEVEQSRHVRLILHATCTNIELARDVRSVSGVDCRSRTGAEFRVRARAYVLATGGLEVPRLLLASNTQLAAGIGNQHDLVGRTYMCHLAGTLGRFTPASGTHPWHGYERTTDGIYCRRRLSIAPSVQAGLRIGNAIARLHHPGLADPSHHTGALSALYLARYLLPFEFRLRLASAAGPVPIMPHIANVLCDPAGTLAFAWQILRHRTLADRKYPSVTVAPRAGAYTLDVHAEQLPNPASRVMLSDHRDGYGVPRLRIDWRYLPEDIHTVRAALGLFKAELEAGGHGVLRFDATRIEADILRDGAYGGHHLGTARMSASQRDGVVDAQCSVHGMPNLFVASSAVFPTSGQANPTLTLVALALRLADYLAAFVAPVAQVAESVA